MARTDCVSHISDLIFPALAIRKTMVKGLCGQRIVKHSMISMLTDLIFPSIQLQLVPVLQIDCKHTIALTLVSKTKAL